MDTGELRKAASAVYLAAPESVADDLSEKLLGAAAELDRLRATGTCLLTGPGRGDCEHFVGLPTVEDETTTDVYGRPHGWCEVCWRGEQISRLRAEVERLHGEREDVDEYLKAIEALPAFYGRTDEGNRPLVHAVEIAGNARRRLAEEKHD